MRVFVAGGTGAIGIPLVRALAAAGHSVTASTRHQSKTQQLRALGASTVIPVVVDALDRDALVAAVEAARPTHVIHQLTALPKDGPRRARDIESTNRLRIAGTRNLLDAAINAGAQRFLVGSFAPLAHLRQGSGGQAPVDRDPAVDAIRSMETQVLDATKRGAIEGVVLRYGMFYGLEAASTVAMIEMARKRMLPVVRGDASQLPVIHLDDAVSATIRALDAAPAGAVYDIVDDWPVSLAEIVRALADYTGSKPPRTVPAWLPRLVAPYVARLTSMRLSLSNAKAKQELGWRLSHPTMKEALGAGRL
jgi:nucleoside-diphosphate-sugar epimerase